MDRVGLAGSASRCDALPASLPRLHRQDSNFHRGAAQAATCHVPPSGPSSWYSACCDLSLGPNGSSPQTHRRLSLRAHSHVSSPCTTRLHGQREGPPAGRFLGLCDPSSSFRAPSDKLYPFALIATYSNSGLPPHCLGSHEEEADVSEGEGASVAPGEESNQGGAGQEQAHVQEEGTAEEHSEEEGDAAGTLNSPGESLAIVRAGPRSLMRVPSGVDWSAMEDAPESSADPSTSDWRAFRARLVASEERDVRLRPGDGGRGVGETMGSGAGDVTGVVLGPVWAHALYAPEKGCILVASELLHGYNFFQRSVILLLGVGTGPSDGPYGIALNKQFPRTVSQLDSILPSLSSTFGACQVHVGGPIGPRTVLLVHGHAGLDGHCEVLPGVFVTGLAGLPAAMQLVESGEAKPEEFQVVLGYAGWGEEQLRQEIEQGWWYVAACSPQVILGAQQLSLGEGDKLWKKVLQLMGGEYAEVGNRSSGDDP